MTDKTTLTVKIVSFSYKKGIPEDSSGNGGGFVFDCRAIPNPGVFDEYKQFTGMDCNVIEYLEKNDSTAFFAEHTQAIVRQSVLRYIERNFSNLSVCFGCTGGQHRSVYFAEQMFNYIKNNFSVNITLEHREQGVSKEYIK